MDPNELHDRKPYKAPFLGKVRLIADEAVLGGCKTTSTPNAEGSVSAGCQFQSCVTDGTS